MGSTSGPNVRLSCHEYGSWYPLKCRLAVGNAPPLQYTYEFVSPSRVQRRHVLELWRYLYRYTVPFSPFPNYTPDPGDNPPDPADEDTGDWGIYRTIFRTCNLAPVEDISENVKDVHDYVGIYT